MSGFLIIAALLFKPAIMAFQSYRKLPKPDRYFSAVCLSCFASFFFVMVSVAVYGWGQNGYMLWIVDCHHGFVYRSEKAGAARPPARPGSKDVRRRRRTESQHKSWDRRTQVVSHSQLR